MDSSLTKSSEDKADSISANWVCIPCSAFKTFSRLDCKTPNIMEEDVPATLLVDLKPVPTKEENLSGVASARADASRNGKWLVDARMRSCSTASSKVAFAPKAS